MQRDQEMSLVCKGKETQTKLRKCKETEWKLIVKVEKLHPDQTTFQSSGNVVNLQRQENQIGVCEGAKRQGTIVNCKMQRELRVCKRCKSEATETHLNLESTKFNAHRP